MYTLTQCLHIKNHHQVCCDNYYSSVPLEKYLNQQQVFCGISDNYVTEHDAQHMAIYFRSEGNHICQNLTDDAAYNVKNIQTGLYHF